MFLLTKPGRNEIELFIDKAADSGFSYPDVGLSVSGSPPGQTVDHNRTVLGRGNLVFETAKKAIRRWAMFDLGWVELCWPDAPVEVGRNVAVLVSHFGFYSLNAARIVYTVDEPDRFGFAYGTLTDHGESGEERFSVEFDAESGEVTYDLFAFSRPGNLFTQLGYPLARMLQKRFAADSLAAMRRAVREGLDPI